MPRPGLPRSGLSCACLPCPGVSRAGLSRTHLRVAGGAEPTAPPKFILLDQESSGFMDQSLSQCLICPACLPQETGLRLSTQESQGQEILQGALHCPACRRVYPVQEGIAVLLAGAGEVPGEDHYTRPQVLSAYLWSHFADLWDDPDAGDAYLRWAALLQGASGAALDVGCAVGRMTLELAASGGFALGIDRSWPFIRLARTLAREGHLEFALTEEGQLSNSRTIRLPERLHDVPAEFLVADALALPFPKSFFRRTASLNLVDKLPEPRRHLDELDRVAATDTATLLVSDPYSWSQNITSPDRWLGGTAEGHWAGRGSDNLRRILTRDCTPAWQVTQEETVPWIIRNHVRHFELIRSHTLLVER